MSCNNRCNSSLACGISNAIVKKLIAENCGEEPIEEPVTSGCEATFVEATMTMDHDNRYSVSFSINGAPIETFYNEDFYFLIDRLTLHPTAIGKAIFILNPDNFPPSGPMVRDSSILAGFTHDGFMAGDLGKRNILNESLLYFDNDYTGPFSFSPEVNTLEIFPTMDVANDLYYFFGGASLGDAPIVVKSCNTLSLGSRPMAV